MTDAGWKQPLHNLRRVVAKTWLSFFPRVIIIGITGSYGKTNTTRAIASVLSQKAPTLQTDLNLDTIYNLPMTLLRLRPRHRFLVLEMGVDHKNEMDFHLSLVKPSIGVLTGITPVHSEPELLGSLAGVIEEKGKLIGALPEDGWAILNHDDENVRKMAQKTKAQILWYGTGIRRGCDFWADNIKVNFSGTTFTLHFDHSNNRSVRVKIPLIGKHFTHAALVAAAVGWIEGLTIQEITSGLSKLEPLAGRMSIEKGPLGTILLNDSLRANPASTMAGLETLVALPCQARRVAVLGEMGELGDFAEAGHRQIGQKVADLKIDFLVSIGPLQRFTAEEAIKNGMKKENVFWVKDVAAAADTLRGILKKDDLLYLKGSLLRHLERVVMLLRGERVDCLAVSCHNYDQCPECPRLRKS